ncbi:MAG TPA: hypothetical protein VID47_19545 [Actinomycetota bacterium]|jgi:hypothetical protein
MAGTRFTYANVMSTLALILALGGTAAATTTVIVKSNHQVAVGTIAGHHPPSGDHANLIPGSIGGTDLSPHVKASFTMSCPSGLQTAFDLCFESTPRQAAVFENALSTCSLAGLRLPTIGELAEVFDDTSAPQEAQWTDDYFFDGSQVRAVAMGDTQLRAMQLNSVTHGVAAPYRCVVTPTNY